MDLEGEHINFTVWNEFEPNGKHIEKCIEIVAKNGTFRYNDISCHNAKCYPCYLPVWQKLNLRGPIPLTIDSSYSSLVEENKFLLKGESKTEITWNNHTWSVGNVISTSGPGQFPPLGLKSWQFVGDEVKLPIALKMSQVSPYNSPRMDEFFSES